MAKPSGRRTAQFKLPQGQPQPSVPSLENNFVAGLKTEYTGLNFPENACTATSNCVFNRIGNVTRRNGIDYETNAVPFAVSRTNSAISTYLWNNAGGDGNTVVEVVQIGDTLYFYQASNATLTNPLSNTQLASTVSLATFSPTGALSPVISECQYTSGNGYLFVFHPDTEPFYCTLNAGVVTAAFINVQVRDFTGVPENTADTYRPLPADITNTHKYNLLNQGWTSQAPWSTSSNSQVTPTVGLHSFIVAAGLPIVLGTTITLSSTDGTQMTGVINFYSGNTLTVNVTSVSGVPSGGGG